MKTTIRNKGKKVTKKEAAEKIGKARLEERIKEAKETREIDPLILNEWADGMTIEFE